MIFYKSMIYFIFEPFSFIYYRVLDEHHEDRRLDTCTGTGTVTAT